VSHIKQGGQSETHNLYHVRVCQSVDWIGLAQDRNKWRSPVNAVTNLRVS
jgi:hypothetical protein